MSTICKMFEISEISKISKIFKSSNFATSRESSYALPNYLVPSENDVGSAKLPKTRIPT